MALFRQSSFAGGEIAPSLHGRSDLALYAHSLATCRNMIVLPHGAVQNRPGTEFIAECFTEVFRSRLVPFIFSDGQAYILEFANLKIRIIARVDGKSGLVESGGSPIEITSPYSSTDDETGQIWKLKFAQSGDVLTITHPSHDPRELKRVAHDNWTLTTYSVAPALSAPGFHTHAPSTEHPGGTDKSRKWEWVVTAVDANGDESLPSPVIYIEDGSSDQVAGEVDNTNPASVDWTAVSGGVKYNIYRGVAGVFGYVRTFESNAAAGTHLFATDDGADPDYSRQPPTARDPVTGSGERPACVAYFQQRLAFARSDNDPQTIHFSKTGDFHNFDQTSPLQDDDALEMRLASLRMDEIRGLVPLKNLLVFTAGAEWTVPGSSALTPSNLSAIPHSYHGSSWLNPLLAGNLVLFVTSHQRSVRELQFDFQSDGYAGRDLTIAARHMFDGQKIIDWTWAETPNGLVWCVRDDGALLGLTYLREFDVVAWHRHDTDGAIESVCAIPEGDEDGVYLVVRRTIGVTTKRYIERLSSRYVTDVRLGIFLDSALSFDGRNMTNFWMRLQNASGWDPGGTVDIESQSDQFASGDVGDEIVFDADEKSGGPYRVRIDSYVDNFNVKGVIQTPIPAAYRNANKTDWAFARDNFSGLGHLEGKEVAILADGASIGKATVTSGAITLPNDVRGVIVHAGLPYESDLELLDLPDPRGRLKKVNRALVDVEASRGLWAGENFDNLYEWQQRAVADAYGAIPVHTGTVEVRLGSSWNRGGRVSVRQVDPLPLTVLGVTRDAEVGGE